MTSSAQAADGPRHFVGASSNNFPPVNVLDEFGELTGFGREMADAVIAAVGGTVEHIHSGRWVEVLDWLAKGEADFIHDTGYVKERETYLGYTAPILEMPERIFVNSDRFDIQSFADLEDSGIKVACVRQHITHLYLKQFSGINCLIVERPVDGLTALISGDADAFIYPRQIALYLAHKLRLRDRVKIVGDPLRTLAWHMTVKKGNTEMVALLNEGIAKVRASGEYDRIYEKWFGESLFAGYSRRELQIITAAAVLLSVVAAGSLVALLFAGRMRRARNRLAAAVTERERVGEELRRQRNFADAVVDNANALICIVDFDGRVLRFNRACERVSGYDADEVMGRRLRDFLLLPEEAERVKDAFAQLRRDRRPLEIEASWVDKAGTVHPIAWAANVILDDNDRISHVINVGIELTERRKAETALRESEALYRTLVDLSPDAILVIESKRIVFANAAAARLHGAESPADLVARTWLDLLHPDEHEKSIERNAKILSGQESGTFIVRKRRRLDGSEVVVETGAARILWQGKPAILGVLRDLTGQREAETELRRSEAQLANAQRLASLGSWERDLLTGEMRWSEETHRIFGLEPGEFGGTHDALMEMIHPEDRDFVVASGRKAIENPPYDIEYRIVRPSGDVRTIHVQAEIVEHDPSGRPLRLSGTAHDITERKRAEAALRESEENVRTLIENSLDIITVLDADGTIRFESPSIETTLGYAVDELVGTSALALVHPDDLDRVASALKQLAEQPSETVSVEFRHQHKDGSWRTLEAIARNLLDHPVVAGIVLNSRDISERLEIEEQLRQAQKMEAVGQLTGGVAHDFNNLLTIILGNAELMSEIAIDDEELRSELASVRRAAQRGASLTRRLLAFSRKQALQPKIVSVNALIEDMAELVERSMGETIEFETRLADDLWATRVDAAQLENVVLNLAVNARDAMPSGGTLAIETCNTLLDDEFAATEPEVIPGRYVMLSVADNGLGMPEEVLDRVFEPFFTTKPVNRGSGLGLSMVYGFIKQSGGHVRIDSQVDGGTTVRVYLPATDGLAAAIEKAEAAEAVDIGDGNGETILVVEDDADVRKFVVRALTGFGYAPIEAREAKSALAMIADRDDLDLLFTDVVLPGGVSGFDLARDVRRIRPDLKILFTSGYMDQPFVGPDRLAEEDQLIAKPYAKEELARKLHKMLGSRAA